MALFLGRLSVLFRDTNEVQKSIAFPIELTFTDPADIDPAINAFLLAVDAVTLARIVGAKLTLDIDLDAGLKNAPVVNSNVNVGATLSMRDSQGNAQPFFIPAVAGAKFLAGGVLNDADGQVLAVINMLKNGPSANSGTATLEFQDEDQRVLEQFARGFRTQRK